MTLPTIQPVDWPDYGQQPTFSYANLTTVGVAAVPSLIAAIPAGYYNYVTLLFVADGDGEDHEYQLNWMDASTSEGGSIVAQRNVQVPFGYNVVVPMTAWAPVLEIWLAGSTATPTSVILYRSLGTAMPQNVGFPGGEYVRLDETTVGASSAQIFVPNGCAPSDHEVILNTTGTSWNLKLRQWSGLGTQVSPIIMSGTAAGRATVRFIPPAGAWDLEYNNLNAGDDDIVLSVERLP